MSEYLIIEGTAKFTHLFEPDEKFSKWSINQYISMDDVTRMLDLQTQGVKNTLKKDEGGYYVNFGRPVDKKNADGKVIRRFDPPRVVDKDGNLLDRNTRIAAGTKVATRLELYEHGTPTGKKAKALRLDSVKILDLVEWVPPPKDENTKPF